MDGKFPVDPFGENQNAIRAKARGRYEPSSAVGSERAARLFEGWKLGRRLPTRRRRNDENMACRRPRDIGAVERRLGEVTRRTRPNRFDTRFLDMKIMKRLGPRGLVLMMSILFCGAATLPAETDEPGPFERLFRAMRHAVKEPKHKSEHRSRRKQIDEGENPPNSESNPNIASTSKSGAT